MKKTTWIFGLALLALFATPLALANIAGLGATLSPANDSTISAWTANISATVYVPGTQNWTYAYYYLYDGAGNKLGTVNKTTGSNTSGNTTTIWYTWTLNDGTYYAEALVQNGSVAGSLNLQSSGNYTYTVVNPKCNTNQRTANVLVGVTMLLALIGLMTFAMKGGLDAKTLITMIVGLTILVVIVAAAAASWFTACV